MSLVTRRPVPSVSTAQLGHNEVNVQLPLQNVEHQTGDTPPPNPPPPTSPPPPPPHTHTSPTPPGIAGFQRNATTPRPLYGRVPWQQDEVTASPLQGQTPRSGSRLPPWVPESDARSVLQAFAITQWPPLQVPWQQSNATAPVSQGHLAPV